jgi:hypothetical protein
MSRLGMSAPTEQDNERQGTPPLRTQMSLAAWRVRSRADVVR